MSRTLFTLGVVLSTSSLLLVDSAIKGCVLLLLAAFVALLLRRDSAATRHLVWQVSIIGMLVVPVFSVVLPQWRVLPAWAVIPASPDTREFEAEEAVSRAPVADSRKLPPRPVESHPVSVEPFVAELPHPTPNVVIDSAVELPVVSPDVVASEVVPDAQLHEWSAFDALPILWLIGFSFLVLRLMAARLMLWSAERRGTVISASQASTLNEFANEPSNQRIVAAFKDACQQFAVVRPVRLLIHPEQTIPVVWGIFRLRLLMPMSARTWSAEQLRSVLLHELAHIKRRDAIFQLLAQVACALHWFNPLVWFAAWRLHVERELACDDLVLANGVPPSAYAEHLLDVATRVSTSRWTQSCGLAMARKSSLEGRLVAVLNRRSNRRSVSASVALLALLLGFGVALPVAMLGPADGVMAAEDSPAIAEDSSAEKGETASDEKVREDAKSENAMPADTTAAVLLKRWQALEERKTPISEASVARLRSAIDKWVKQPPAKADAAQVLALRDRHIDRAEHPTFEVAGWLSAIAAVHRGPLEFAINGETRIGAALSEERQATLKFGPVAENGLRAAWSRYPERDTYVVGDVVTSAVVIQNASDKTVEFTCPYSVDSLVKWSVTSRDGRKIPAKTSSLRGSTPIFTWRLKPGEATSIGGRSVAIGVGARREKIGQFPVTTVLDAKAGEDVTVRWDVRKPVEMATGDVRFNMVAVEDVPVWSTRRAGNWQLAGGVTMEVKEEVFHGADVATTAILTWPRDKDGGTARHKIRIAADAFTNRASWLIAWEAESTVLWTLACRMQPANEFGQVNSTPRYIRRIDFTDRERITETLWLYLPDVVPETIRTKLADSFLPMATEPKRRGQAYGHVKSTRAEDERSIEELLNGRWKSQESHQEVTLTFPKDPSDKIRWTINFNRKPGDEPLDESLTPLKSLDSNSIRLIRNADAFDTNPADGLVGVLRRGIGDKLLLDWFERTAYPEFKQNGFPNRVRGRRLSLNEYLLRPMPSPTQLPSLKLSSSPKIESHESYSASGRRMPAPMGKFPVHRLVGWGKWSNTSISSIRAKSRSWSRSLKHSCRGLMRRSTGRRLMPSRCWTMLRRSIQFRC